MIMKIKLFKNITCQRPTLTGWLLIIFTIVIVLDVMLKNVYGFLTVNEPVKSKTMVIEGWIPDYSVKKALKLFKEDHYKNLIVTGTPIKHWQLLTDFTNVADATAAMIKKLGFRDTIYLAAIPSNIIRDRTYTTAIVTKTIFEQHPDWEKSFNIYSVGVHSRRSRLLFDKAFGDNYKIGIYADRDISFDPEHWWTSSKGFRNVGNELLAYFYVRFFFHPGSKYYKNEVQQGKYIDSILSYRRKAIEEFANPEESPLDSLHFYSDYHNPEYFPVNVAFKVKAKFSIDTTGDVFGMATNTARKPNYRIYGHLTFSVGDTIQKLTAYQNIDFMDDPGYGKYLFVPFRDKTNGKITYGAGRYLDILIPKTDSVYIDFNKSYNPYCAYSDKWSCPLVPFENHLDVYILAGEKKYREIH